MNYIKTKIALLFVTLCCVAGGFYANEARKEVVYLCGNFTYGVTEKSVLRQLSTANLSGYRIETNPTSADPLAKRIVFASQLHAGLLRCVILINGDKKVSIAKIE